MSFKTRERKRKQRAAVKRDQARARESGSAAQRWYLTIVTKPCSCNNVECGRHMRPGSKNDPRELVYRREPRAILCVDCAQKIGIRYRPSLRWEQSRRAKVKRGPAWMREAGKENGR